MPSATAILDRFLHHAEAIAIIDKSYRLRKENPQPDDTDSKPANLPTDIRLFQTPQRLDSAFC